MMTSCSESVRLTFDAATHAYTLDGASVPGVTGVLDPYTGLEYVNREVLEAARELGSAVHEAVDLFNTGALEFCPPALEPYLDGWRAFLHESGAVVVASERRVYSERLRYAGTLDVIVWWGDSEALVDVKSGSVVPRTVGPQTAAYLHAYNEETRAGLRRRYCVHLTGDGRYRAHKLTDSRDWQVFQSALNVHRWWRGER